MKNIFRKTTIAALALLLLLNVFVLVACNRTVKADTVYYIDTKESKIMNIPLTLILDKESNITLRKDGTASVSIKTSAAFAGALNLMLSNEAVSDFDLQPIIEGMAMDFFPGFTLEDMQFTFNLLKHSLNLSIVGLDPSDPNVKAIFDEIAETGKVPSNITLPQGIGIEYNAEYRIEKVTSEFSGEYTGIFMGKQHKNGEPYIMMTLRQQKDSDKQEIYFRNEMINFTLIAKEA